MRKAVDNLTIGALADAAGVNVETIRFYQRKGLLPEPERRCGSIRRYGLASVARVRFIKTAQRLGFTLANIGQLLRLDDGAHCSQVKDIAALKLADVRHRMSDLQRIEVSLAQLVDSCAASQGKVSCPLIASLQGTI